MYPCRQSLAHQQRQPPRTGHRPGAFDGRTTQILVPRYPTVSGSIGGDDVSVYRPFFDLPAKARSMLRG